MLWGKYRLILVALIVCWDFTGAVQAADEKVIDHSLSLAGYQLGMSLDQAASIRPVQYIDVTTFDDHIVAFVAPFKMNDIEMELRLSSAKGSVFKIIARFPPASTVDILQRLQTELGPAENDIITYLSKDNREVTQEIYVWTFPHARLHIVKNANNESFATLALVVED